MQRRQFFEGIRPADGSFDGMTAEQIHAAHTKAAGVESHDLLDNGLAQVLATMRKSAELHAPLPNVEPAIYTAGFVVVAITAMMAKVMTRNPSDPLKPEEIITVLGSMAHMIMEIGGTLVHQTAKVPKIPKTDDGQTLH
jgi:hypothetical protein